MPEDCVHCGGSGILNIVSWAWQLPNAQWVEDEPFAASCHACPRGLEMRELLND